MKPPSFRYLNNGVVSIPYGKRKKEIETGAFASANNAHVILFIQSISIIRDFDPCNALVFNPLQNR